MTPRSSTDPAAPGPLLLTPEDVERLLHESSPDARIGVLQKIATSHQENVFDDHELEVAEQIFRLLMRDTEIKVRAALSESLKENPNIPHDVIASLAKDVEEVALPVVRYSEVLTDIDLLDLIRNRTDITFHIAIAQRDYVSSKISAALVDTGREEVVSELVQNPRADISTESYQRILEEHGTHTDIVSSMVTRKSLPITVVERLITFVSGTIKEELSRKYKLSAPDVSLEADQTREMATINLMDAGQYDPEEVEKLVSQLYAFGRLSPSIILTALCRGNILFFEHSLAKLAHIPPRNASILLGDRGGLGFKALYAKSGLPDSMQAAVQLLLGVVRSMKSEQERPGNVHFANRVVEKLLHASEGKQIENLSYIIALVRQSVKRQGV